MDYSVLAVELLSHMHILQKLQSQKNIFEAMQGEAFVLGYIASQSGEVLPGEIGNKMGVTSARIANTLNGLEKKGLITREIDKNDRRKILVRITQEGKELATKHKQTMMSIASQMLELLGENDAKEYVRLVKKLAELLHNNDLV